MWSQPPTGRDYFLKMIYDKIRNNENFNLYTNPPDNPKLKKKEMDCGRIDKIVEEDKSNQNSEEDSEV